MAQNKKFNFKVKILDQDTHNITLEMKNVSIIMANSLRRSSLILVPTMAIEHIYVYDNTSVMNDQMLSLRIGHIPLVTDLNRYILPDECDCESEYGCNNCSTTLTLNVTSGDDVVTVTSNDIKSQDNSSLPVSDNIPITKLVGGQTLTLEMKATLGRGDTHSKWQAATVAIATSLDEDESSSILKIESNGQLPPLTIINESISILINKLDILQEKIKKLEKKTKIKEVKT